MVLQKENYPNWRKKLSQQLSHEKIIQKSYPDFFIQIDKRHKIVDVKWPSIKKR